MTEILFASCLVLAVAAAGGQTVETDAATVSDEMVAMKDGVKLHTRTVVPKGAIKCPVIFTRTPYADRHPGPEPSSYTKNESIRRGYALVHQHCRGTGKSEGVCVPYTEREDGLATLEFIRRQPWYNGDIFITGGSYGTTVHLTYLSADPPDIKGAALDIQTDRMYFRDFRNGCNYAYSNLGWWAGMLKRRYPGAQWKDAQVRPYKDIAKRVWGEDVPEYTGKLMSIDPDAPLWKNDSRENVIDHIRFPVLFGEGWYDFYIEGMSSMWERLPPETKAKSAFVIGPWGHSTQVRKDCPLELPNGNMSGLSALDWFDSIRKGTPFTGAELGKLKYYSVGGGDWRESIWPRTSAVKTRAFRLGADGVIVEGAAQTGERAYDYDPMQTPNCFPFHQIAKAFAPGKYPGVLSFVSAPFTEEVRFFGRPRVKVPVKSNCDDTQFFFRIYFADESGVAYNLTETIAALRYVKKDYKAGETLTLDLELPPIAFTVKKGWRIRLDISSYGGVYVPHANVAGHWAEVTETKVAHNSVICGEATLELPLE